MGSPAEAVGEALLLRRGHPIQATGHADLVTLGWVYCLYVAPLWALVFWFLIRPGPLTRFTSPTENGGK